MIIDDEEIILKSCGRILGRVGYRVETARDARAGMKAVIEGHYDVLIVDLMMPEVSGMDILRSVREYRPETEVIMITGYSTVQSAVEAMRLGASDYVPKPFNPDELEIAVEKAMEKRNLLEVNRYLREELHEKYRLDNLIGRSPAMVKVFRQIARVSSTSGTVLITGESGTGKEVVSRAIHFSSPRREAPFVVVDCSTLAPTILESELFGHVKGSFTGAARSHKGLFELADGGTLFLDEVTNINPEIQGKLLRVVESREIRPVGAEKLVEIDIRLIAATNRDIQEMVERGEFREDLFYRLNVIPIELPPLRERIEDIPLLVSHFLRELCGQHGREIRSMHPEAIDRLSGYSWPGNVRELRNAVERLVILVEGSTITGHQVEMVLGGTQNHARVPRDFQELKAAKKAARDRAVEQLEASFLLTALERNGWNVSRTAEDIGIQRPNLHALMRKHGIRSERHSR